MTVIRRPGAASVSVLVGVTVSLAVAHLIAPEWSRPAGLDVWNLPELRQTQKQIDDERAELDGARARLQHRIEAADHIATRLLNGELTLATAADELALLHDDGSQTSLETHHPDAPSKRHVFARHTIERVARLLQDEPARCKAIRERLEAEYRSLSSGQ